MKQSLQKLQKFFKLEAERGYDNRAVVGGLERMLERWEAEARADSLPQELIQAVTGRLRDYARLTPASRAEILEGLLRRIQRETGVPPASVPGALPASPPAPRQTARHDEPPRLGEEPGAPPLSVQSPAPIDSLSSPSPEREQDFRLPSQELSQPEMAPDEPALPEAVAPDQGEGIDQFESDQDSEEGSFPAPSYPVRPLAAPSGPPAALNAPTTVLSGVGPRHAQTLARLGIETLRDMLYYFPRRYDDYSRLKPINRLWYGEEVTVIGTVQKVNARPLRSGRFQVVEAVVSDGSGALRISWFNQPWIAKRLRTGAHVVLSGKIDQYLGRLVMNNPEVEPLEQEQLSTNRIVPVYPLTAQITQRWLRRLLNTVVTYWAPRVYDPLPPDLRRSAGLMDLSNALIQIHFPVSWDSLKAARHRLAFDEIFLLQLGVLRQKSAWQDRTARVFEPPADWLQSQTDRLPFPLTGAQQRALQDLRQDFASGRPMNRLLQGDVGSGKTVVGALAAAIVVREGAQAAMMAPTSILAEQHYKNLKQLLCGPGGRAGQAPTDGASIESPTVESPSTAEGTLLDEMVPGEGPVRSYLIPTPEPSLPYENQNGDRPPALAHPAPLRADQIRLLVGATPEAEKREIRAGLAEGSIKVVIGTHALIENPVQFADLQLVVVDEQHRFGVDQRASLRSKGDNPHLLVMTATPIPRSLALTVYGDLDLSVMDEMPPGRQEISTHVLPPRERERAYSLIRAQVEQGRQAFIIYPLVEESDKSESKAAVEEHTRLQKEVFPGLKLGLLHGRMKPEEKEEVMTSFRDGEIHVLVSTSVVEVGVDVSNATVMLIEGANRFGLAQLHQFRGRVGRGAEKSYCLLIPETPDAIENERLQVMVETNDGFKLAERDLDQRGPGQFLGTRQSGFSELQLASLTDVQLIEKARRLAQASFEKDPGLEDPQYRPLVEALERFWGDSKGDIS